MCRGHRRLALLFADRRQGCAKVTPGLIAFFAVVDDGGLLLGFQGFQGRASGVGEVAFDAVHDLRDLLIAAAHRLLELPQQRFFRAEVIPLIHGWNQRRDARHRWQAGFSLDGFLS